MSRCTRTSLAEARRNAAKAIKGLSKGTVSPLVADAIYKQNLTIIDSYRVELRGIELAIKTSSTTLDYNKAVALIAKHEK